MTDFKTYLNEQEKEPAFVKEDAKRLQDMIKAPYVTVQFSSLGGVGNESLMIRVSLESKEEWTNGIFHNSPGFMLAIHGRSGKIENGGYGAPSRDKKSFRKVKYKDLEDAAKKINKYIEQVS